MIRSGLILVPHRILLQLSVPQMVLVFETPILQGIRHVPFGREG